jgi:REP element-mobilizing transposase RayT
MINQSSSPGAYTTAFRQTARFHRPPSPQAKHSQPWTDYSTQPGVETSTFASRTLQTWSSKQSTTTRMYWGIYQLHAFVVMPNHVRLLVTPTIALPRIMKSLKGITARRATAMLTLTGTPFWQEESYDHLVRDEHEFKKISHYIEENPVRAGLVKTSSDHRWSSAAEATRGSAPQLTKHLLADSQASVG